MKKTPPHREREKDKKIVVFYTKRSIVDAFYPKLLINWRRMDLRSTSKFGSQIPVRKNEEIDNAKHSNAKLKCLEQSLANNETNNREFGSFRAELKCIQQSVADSIRNYGTLVKALTEKMALNEKMRSLEHELNVEEINTLGEQAKMFNEQQKMLPENVPEEPAKKRGRGRPPKQKPASLKADIPSITF